MSPEKSLLKVDTTKRIVAHIENVSSTLPADLNVTSQEITVLVKTVDAFLSGERQIPGINDFLKAQTPRKKVEVALDAIEGILTETIIPANEMPPSLSLKLRVGSAFNQISFFLGVGDGKEILMQTIADLPDLERALLCQGMGTSLKIRLNRPDLDICDPQQFADYIKEATYHGRGVGITLKAAQTWPHSQNITELKTLFEHLMERAERGEINATEVLDILYKEDYFPHMIERIIAAAHNGKFLDYLEQIFHDHPGTAPYCRKCHELLAEDE